MLSGGDAARQAKPQFAAGRALIAVVRSSIRGS
jgi:hypothetical protein